MQVHLGHGGGGGGGWALHEVGAAALAGQAAARLRPADTPDMLITTLTLDTAPDACRCFQHVQQEVGIQEGRAQVVLLGVCSTVALLSQAHRPGVTSHPFERPEWIEGCAGGFRKHLYPLYYITPHLTGHILDPTGVSCRAVVPFGLYLWSRPQQECMVSWSCHK